MILASHLSKNYGDIKAVDDISFEIEQGEVIGLLGLNGAGKTTLLRMLGCLLTPSGGQAHLDSLEVQADPLAVRGRIGYLPEVPPLYGEMRVEDFLHFVARLRGVSRRKSVGQVKKVMGQCHVDDVASQRIETLSFGYRKRVGIAQAIVHAPPILLLDEPIAGLDPAQIVEMRALIRHLAGEHTVLLSSHILSEISQTCDRILVVHRGRLAAQGSEEELVGRFVDKARLVLEVAGDRKMLEQVLDGLGDDFEIHWLESMTESLKLELHSEKDMRSLVAKAVVEAGLELLGLQAAGGDLESVFLQLTGEAEGRS